MDAWLDRPEFTVWSILQARGKTGCCFTIEGEPRDGVKMVRIPSIMYFEIVPVEGHEPDHYRYVESTPSDLPLLKIGLQHFLPT